MQMPALTIPQKRAIALRLGVPSQVVSSMADSTVSKFLNQQYSLQSMRLRIEFEALRQVNRAWEQDDLK